MIYFSLARGTTVLLCYTIFHTLIDKRRKEISLFSTKTFYKSSLYETFLSSQFISKGETKTALSIINGDCPFMPLTPYNLFNPLRHFVTPPLYFAVQNTEEEVEYFLSYRQKLHDKRMSQNSSLPCLVALRGVPKEIGGVPVG